MTRAREWLIGCGLLSSLACGAEPTEPGGIVAGTPATAGGDNAGTPPTGGASGGPQKQGRSFDAGLGRQLADRRRRARDGPDAVRPGERQARVRQQGLLPAGRRRAARLVRHERHGRSAGEESFSFTGDDDLWVFINGKLAIDLGGVHAPMAGEVDLAARAAELGLQPGEEYPIDFFQAERMNSQSNFHVETSLAFTNCDPIIVVK